MPYTESEIQEIVSNFIKLINTPAPAKPGKKRVEPREAPALKNSYKVNGLKAQQPKKAPKGAYVASLEERSDQHHEKHLQKAIVDHPFLLHTPELYAGGLYLDTLLNQMAFPFPRITDFCYITTQERTIKITLVEIEQSAKHVFTQDKLGHEIFHGDTRKAIEQVQDWQFKLRAQCHKASLLANLWPLFRNYPLELFLPSGDPHHLTRIELSYVLIVGNEMPNAKQQALIDELYVKNDILFMTYPMMLETMNGDFRQKNVFSVRASGLTQITVDSPESIGPTLETIDLPSCDPFGIKTAALGRPWQYDPLTVSNAGQMKAAFYRSGGQCEKPGCSTPLIVNGRVEARLVRIYNRHGELDEVKNWWHTYNTALVCPGHEKTFNSGHRYAYGHPHPLNDRMHRAGPYRHDLDLASVQFTEQWLEDIKPEMLAVLGIDAINEVELAAQVTDVVFALRKLSIRQAGALDEITRDFFKVDGYYLSRRTAERALTNPYWNSLLRARLIRINLDEAENRQVEPAFFSHELMARFEERFKDRTYSALGSLLSANPSKLRFQLGRVGQAAWYRS